MTQSRLNRQVARATGDDPATIARLGFVILTRGPVEREHGPRFIGVDDHCAQANLRFRKRHCRGRTIP
jgi:hypothetical protein